MIPDCVALRVVRAVVHAQLGGAVITQRVLFPPLVSIVEASVVLLLLLLMMMMMIRGSALDTTPIGVKAPQSADRTL